MTAGFNNAWYAEIIERFSPDTNEPPSDALARCILVAACILAEAIDGVTAAIEKHAEAMEG